VTRDTTGRVRAIVREAAVRTPLVPFETVWLKLENIQPFGSFKIRGAYHAVRSLSKEERARGVWTVSAGNMGQGLAYAARKVGVPCMVVVPDSAPETKCASMESLGARLLRVPFERWWQAIEERAFPGAEGVFIHPCDDERVIAGNSTIGAEIMEDMPDVDTVIVPWGGGGLACGVAQAVRATVWAAEVETAAPLKASLDAGEPRTVERKPSFVDGIGGSSVLPRMFEIAKVRIAGSIVVSIDEVRRAVRDLAVKAHVVAEGAGAASVAASRKRGPKIRKTVCVISGGNIEAAVLAEILADSR